MIENRHDRRPDVVIFVNGLPIGVIELKNAANEGATVDGAFNQIQTYKSEIPSLFRTNAVLVISDGRLARVGSLTAERERFMPWRTVTGSADDFTPHGPREFETLIRGLFTRELLLELIRDFTVFGDKGKGPFKIIAGYHPSASDEARQIRDEVGFFQAVRAALVKTSIKGKLSDQRQMFAVGQLINQAIANTEVVDILAAAGISSAQSLRAFRRVLAPSPEDGPRKPRPRSASQAARWRDQELVPLKRRREPEVLRAA